MESVGTRVRHYRRLRRLTQDALAEQSGVERRYLGKIETGDVLEPGAETVRKLSRALNVPVRQLAEPLGWWADEPSGDALAAAEAAVLSEPGLSDERRQAALVVLRDLFARGREQAG